MSILIFLGTSCEENFFEKQPPGEVTEDVLANRDGAERLLAGAYAALQGAPSDCYASMWAGTDNRLYGSIAADDANTGSAKGDHPEMWIFEQYEALPSNEAIESKWDQNYDGISRANKALEIINEASDEIPDDQVTEMKAEARFIRGWLHYS
ncbi:MAG: RagB/SusD family nutrient uptake outer membrane protein, partial [Bacteroidota bacterium]